MSLTDPRGIYSLEIDGYKKARERLPDANTILDTLDSPGGLKWWQEFGLDMMNAKFDLMDGSRSMKALEVYINARRTKENERGRS